MNAVTLFTNAQVITGDHDLPLVDAAVLVEGGSISAVGRPTSLDSPPGAEVIDCAGQTLLPGLVDCHEHLTGRGRYAEGINDLGESDATWAMVLAHYAQENLRRGVTTVRIPGAHHGVDLAVRRASSQGHLVMPRLICAGEAITMTGGHGSDAAVQADGPAECMKAARAQLANGADFIKVMASGGVGTVRVGEDPTHPELTVAEIAAVVTAAQSARKYVTAHADGVEGIENALRAGVHCIEHGIYLTAAQAADMAARNVRLVPTLSTMLNIAHRGDEWGLSAEWVEIGKRVIDVHRESFQNAVDAGVMFGTGTDGYGAIVDEIIEFTSYGISPMKAIQAATRDAAQIAKPGADFGVLAPGLAADLLVVDGDPLTDLERLREVTLVMRAGRIVHRRCEADS